jgi:ATP-dependent Clp protease ATP-binding subunit ClpA
VEADDSAAELLADRGYDPEFGARPLKRTIQRLVQDELARRLLAGEIGEGAAVLLTARGGELELVAS